ncbi:MAG: histidine kinase, partial [Algicola sp.]|nr:histidine kinase [Algicola sp.]
MSALVRWRGQVFCLLWLYLLCGAQVSGQTNDFEDRITTAQGLSHNVVNSVVQDAQGFMWFATQDGLNRYDGYNITIFRHDPDDPDSISDSYVQTLYVDKSGVLWAGAVSGGLNRFNSADGTFTSFVNDPQNDQSIAANIAVTSIVEDSQGHFWIGSLGGGVGLFDRSNETFTHYRHDANNSNSLGDNQVYVIFEDSKKQLWVGTRTKGLNHFDPLTGQFTRYQHQPSNDDSLSHNRVYALGEDQAGNLWVGTRGGGLELFDRDARRFVHYLKPQDNEKGSSAVNVWSFYLDNNQQFWMGTDNGRIQYDSATGQFLHRPFAAQDPNQRVMSMVQDKTGILWFGTFGFGLAKQNLLHQQFNYIAHKGANPTGLPNSDINAILTD